MDNTLKVLAKNKGRSAFLFNIFIESRIFSGQIGAVKYFIYPRSVISDSGAEQTLKQTIQIEHNKVKNPNWPEANQLAIYKLG